MEKLGLFPTNFRFINKNSDNFYQHIIIATKFLPKFDFPKNSIFPKIKLSQQNSSNFTKIFCELKIFWEQGYRDPPSFPRLTGLPLLSRPHKLPLCAAPLWTAPQKVYPQSFSTEVIRYLIVQLGQSYKVTSLDQIRTVKCLLTTTTTLTGRVAPKSFKDSRPTEYWKAETNQSNRASKYIWHI